MKVIHSSFKPGEENYKWIDLPQPNYASSSFDRVMMGDKLVGLSMFNGYSFNERCMLSLGVVDAEREGRRRADAHLGRAGRRHGQDLDRAPQAGRDQGAVSPTPYASEARENYADSWRTRKS
jgi:vanillate/3-O-methylgallate O-demethylase